MDQEDLYTPIPGTKGILFSYFFLSFLWYLLLRLALLKNLFCPACHFHRKVTAFKLD